MQLAKKSDASFRIIKYNRKNRQKLASDDSRAAFPAQARNSKTCLRIFEAMSGKFKPIYFTRFKFISSARANISFVFNFASFKQFLFIDEFVVKSNRSGKTRIELEEPRPVAFKAAPDGGR